MDDKPQTEEQPQDEPQAEGSRDGHVTARDFNPSDNPVVDEIKRRVEELAGYIEGAVPAGRRRSIALTHLETASMFAVKANFYPEG